MGVSVLGVIPSRYGAMRFPGKPLAKIHGRPMIEWVYRRARKALPRVVVATDDKRIFNAVKAFGGEALMTSKSCQSGTDRMYEVARKIRADYYANVQGDEPLIDPATVKRTVQISVKKKSIATAATRLQEKDRANPNVVKVVLNGEGRALYFSRAGVPFVGHGVQKPVPALKHLGLYVYPRAVLLKFATSKPAALEKTEKLEQLRALYNGWPIYVYQTNKDSVGVDTPEDLKKVARLIKKI